MEFRYPRRVPHLSLAFAAAIVLSVLLVEPRGDAPLSRGLGAIVLMGCALYVSLYTLRFAVRVDAECLSVFSWSKRRFPISDIVEVSESTPNLFFGVFTRTATIRLTDSRQITLLGYLEGFDDLVAMLRRRSDINRRA